MTAREQLDTLLKYLYDKKDETRGVDIDVIKGDEKLIKMAGNASELERMILKLRDDKLMQIWPDSPLLPNGKKDISKPMITYCSITFDGRLFFEDGAYTQQSINENQERERIRVLETYPDILNRRTLWVVLATFFLGLIELLKWCYDNRWFPFCNH